MAVSESGETTSLDVLILDEDPSAQVSLRDLVSQLGDTTCSFSLFECPRRARESLNQRDYDLVFLEEKFGELLESRTRTADNPDAPETPSFVMLTEGNRPKTENAVSDIDADAILSKNNLNDQLLSEILRDVFLFDQKEKFSRTADDSNFYNRNYLKNYLNTILSRYRDTDFQWLLVMLQIQGYERGKGCGAQEQIGQFFRKLTDLLQGDEIIDPTTGRYDREVFWGLYPCLDLPADLTRTAGKYLLELNDRISRAPDPVAECNMVLHRLKPGDFSLSSVFDEIDRSLDRVDITPGPSVINHTYQ